MGALSAICGDITGIRADAIVNAANPTRLGGGGVDGAIHRAAGPELLAMCQAVPEIDGQRCPVGEARITGAGNLPAMHVIHTVGPRFHHDPNPAALLASAYRNSLQLAEQHACHSIVFPAISCGVFAYPPEQAAVIAVTTCREPAFSALDIQFCLFSDPLHCLWQKAIDD